MIFISSETDFYQEGVSQNVRHYFWVRWL